MRVLHFIIQRALPYQRYVVGMFVAMCFITIDNTLKPFLVKHLIDTVSGRQSTNLWLIAAGYGLLQCMLVGSWILSDYCLTKYVAKFRLDVVEHFMKRLYNYPYDFFQNQLSGSLTSKLNDVFQHLPHLIFTLINPFCYFLLLISISITLLFLVAPIFAVSLILWVSLFLVITFFSMKKSMLLNKEYAEEKSNIVGLCADYLSNMLSVKTFTGKNYELRRFTRLKNTFISIAQKGGIYHTWLYAFLGFFTSIYALGFIVFLILGFKKGSLSPGDVALVIMLNFNIINTVYELSHRLRDFVLDWSAVHQALALLENTVEQKDMVHAKKLIVDQGQIVFHQVEFQYHGLPSLFQNKSVIIERGQKVGLVGYSGGGKSTFVNLILRLYDITGGQILIDGQNISEVTQDSLRQAIAMIPQDPMLFHRSLLDNIRYGRTDATDDEVIAASIQAHAHDFISLLPNGYDALVGERGVKLSGGQRQRIAIARAILKNAPILILDEATSALDSITEANIQESLWELMRSKTTLVIAHRLSTLLHMDRILVFDKGHIIEDGTHAELLKLGGLYKTLWEAQVGDFLPG
ncbi:MAG: ABC transporter ATP-binding protein [Legionella sp.]|nr:ABC transporter ATP-binding protein [Legionella sp.]